jgi:hypothetical protein
MITNQGWTQLHLSLGDWAELAEISKVLYYFKEATDLTSGSSYVTVYDTVSTYEYLEKRLNKFKAETAHAQLKLAIDAAQTKLHKYYDKLTPLTIISSILDPRKNIRYIQVT